MANNVYVNAQGKKYTANTPASPADQLLPFVHSALAAQLSAIPTDEATVHATFIASQHAGNKWKNSDGWFYSFFLILALLASLLLFSGAAKAQATPYHALSAATNNATSVATGALTVWDLQLINTTATVVYFRFYDSAVSPTCSSATGVIFGVAVPASATGNGLVPSFPVGKVFISGIAYCLTGAVADNDNTNAVTGIQINFNYGGNMRP